MNRDNLLKLAAGVAHSRKFKFNMSYLRADKNFNTVPFTAETAHCGTVACALGHGPAIKGLELKSEHLTVHPWMVWNKYCEDTFNLNFFSLNWRWLFDVSWENLDNTRAGFVKRVLWLLDGKDIILTGIKKQLKHIRSINQRLI